MNKITIFTATVIVIFVFVEFYCLFKLLFDIVRTITTLSP